METKRFKNKSLESVILDSTNSVRESVGMSVYRYIGDCDYISDGIDVGWDVFKYVSNPVRDIIKYGVQRNTFRNVKGFIKKLNENKQSQE
jgi:hypothetical protein